jgi:hypothetical protein
MAIRIIALMTSAKITKDTSAFDVKDWFSSKELKKAESVVNEIEQLGDAIASRHSSEKLDELENKLKDAEKWFEEKDWSKYELEYQKKYKQNYDGELRDECGNLCKGKVCMMKGCYKYKP